MTKIDKKMVTNRYKYIQEPILGFLPFTNTMVRKRDSFKGTGSGDRQNDKMDKNGY
jgi:hypothetical protein